jgi:2-polyprenyl-3-methyl-5-hydroxy-6-metoxy-1,4-benzoquinol methylase
MKVWTRAEMEAFVKREKWYQSIEVAPGLWTKGGYDCKAATRVYGWPERMDGVRFLDTGCNAGFYVCYAKQLGADESVGIDREAGQLKKARAVAEMLQVDVTFHQIDFYELPQTVTGPFRWVQCLNLFHHLRKPWEAMRILSTLCGDDGTLIWEGMVFDDKRREKGYKPIERLPEEMAHHEYVPTSLGVRKMFTEVGFKRIDYMGSNRWNRLIFRLHKSA